MTRVAVGYLSALALLAALTGCTARAPFELPDLDAPASPSAQVTPQGSYPTYRYGYRPNGPYGLYGPYGYGQPSSRQPRNEGATAGAAPVPTPEPVVPEPPPPRPPRPPRVDREPPETPVRTTRPVDDTPTRRQQER
jgi:predicted small lipoprotein YifL